MISLARMAARFWGISLALPLLLVVGDAPSDAPPVPSSANTLPVNAARASQGINGEPASARPLAPRPSPPVVWNPDALAFDAKLKTYDAKAGETQAHLTFSVTNIAKTNVLINSVHTSCGCTVAKLPAQPWNLLPGAAGQIDVTVDLNGKFGTINKTATIYSSAGNIPLSIRVNIPMPDPRVANRSRNMQIAVADRQAVFRGECVSCHVTPTVGKSGHELYDTACGICHDAAGRASMVPDLHALTKPTDKEYWTLWITNGKDQSLMPAFALAKGGILTDLQIQSLADYLTGEFKLHPGIQPAALNPAGITK